MSSGTRQTELQNQFRDSTELFDGARIQRGRAILGASGASPDESVRGSLRTVKAFVSVTLTLWLGAVAFFGSRGSFVLPPGTPPYPIALGFVVPLIVFLGAFWMSATFRELVMGGDVPLLTALQSWRFAGFGFIALYAYGVLPGSFAWPAGLGDMAIGLTAPWLALALARRPSVAASRLFVVWNVLGILDLVAAIASGALNQVLATGSPGQIAILPMAQLPLLLIPAFLVPLFVMLHLTALFQTWRLTHASR
jgi:hypothetical protein